MKDIEKGAHDDMNKDDDPKYLLSKYNPNAHLFENIQDEEEQYTEDSDDSDKEGEEGEMEEDGDELNEDDYDEEDMNEGKEEEYPLDYIGGDIEFENGLYTKHNSMNSTERALYQINADQSAKEEAERDEMLTVEDIDGGGLQAQYDRINNL